MATLMLGMNRSWTAVELRPGSSCAPSGRRLKGRRPGEAGVWTGQGVLLCDAQPPHSETGLATRPIAGTAPRFAPGLDPRTVADRILTGIEGDQAAIPAGEF